MIRGGSGVLASLGGLAASQVQQNLFTIRGADFAIATDQTLTKIGTFTNYVITSVIAARKTGGATVACAGGIYTAASKGGTALVANTQSWVLLSGAGKIVIATLAAANATDFQTATPILSLTTGSTGAVTADVFIYGVVVD